MKVEVYRQRVARLVHHCNVAPLSQIVAQLGKPQTIESDNGSEFIGNVIDKWAHKQGIELNLSALGKPTNNTMLKSLNDERAADCAKSA